MEADRQIFTAEGESIALLPLHVVISISEKTISGYQAEVVGQLQGDTWLETQFKARFRVCMTLFR